MNVLVDNDNKTTKTKIVNNNPLNPQGTKLRVRVSCGGKKIVYLIREDPQHPINFGSLRNELVLKFATHGIQMGSASDWELQDKEECTFSAEDRCTDFLEKDEWLYLNPAPKPTQPKTKE